MTTRRLSRYLAGTFVLCFLSTIVLVSCGSNSSSTNTTASSPATATACAQLRSRFARPVTGTVQSVSGQTVHITESSGGSIDATYSSTTRITQQTLATTSALQAGANVLIQVQQNSNGSSYTATSITLTQGGQFGQGQNGTGQGRRPGTDGTPSACFGGGRGRGRGAGTGNGNGNGNSGGQTSGRNTLVGTIGQVNGTNSLTVTDRQKNTYTVALASDTKIIQSGSATSSAIQAGMGITVMGQTNNGVITATSMTIYAAGLTPPSMSAPTPSTT